MNKDYIKLNKAIKKRINIYKNIKDLDLKKSNLKAIKSLWDKRKLIQENNYIVKDMTLEMIGVYASYIPYHYYLFNIKYPFRLLENINKDFKKLPNHIYNWKLCRNICEKCPLHHCAECFNCFCNQDIMDKVIEGYLEYKKNKRS